MARTRSGRRTDYSWNSFGDVISAVDISATAVRGSLGFEFTQAQTATRIRGMVGATLNTGGVNELGILLIGLVIMGRDAFTAGIAPELTTSTGRDEASWIWQGAIYMSSGSEGAVVTDHLSGFVEIDTKAMRRVKSGETLTLVVQAPPELWNDVTGTIDVSYFVHVLSGL